MMLTCIDFQSLERGTLNYSLVLFFSFTNKRRGITRTSYIKTKGQIWLMAVVCVVFVSLINEVYNVLSSSSPFIYRGVNSNQGKVLIMLLMIMCSFVSHFNRVQRFLDYKTGGVKK